MAYESLCLHCTVTAVLPGNVRLRGARHGRGVLPGRGPPGELHAHRRGVDDGHRAEERQVRDAARQLRRARQPLRKEGNQ